MGDRLIMEGAAVLPDEKGRIVTASTRWTAVIHPFTLVTGSVIPMFAHLVLPCHHDGPRYLTQLDFLPLCHIVPASWYEFYPFDMFVFLIIDIASPS
jgi:hypothetical protein